MVIDRFVKHRRYPDIEDFYRFGTLKQLLYYVNLGNFNRTIKITKNLDTLILFKFLRVRRYESKPGNKEFDISFLKQCQIQINEENLGDLKPSREGIDYFLFDI